MSGTIGIYVYIYMHISLYDHLYVDRIECIELNMTDFLTYVCIQSKEV